MLSSLQVAFFSVCMLLATLKQHVQFSIRSNNANGSKKSVSIIALSLPVVEVRVSMQLQHDCANMNVRQLPVHYMRLLLLYTMPTSSHMLYWIPASIVHKRIQPWSVQLVDCTWVC